MGDAVGEDTRLARPGTRHHEQGATLVKDCVVLGWIETGKQGDSDIGATSDALRQPTCWLQELSLYRGRGW